MLRLAALALVLANLAFFGWTSGWFAPTWPAPRHGDREPARLDAQVRPELISVLPPKAASAAVQAARAAARVCLEAGPYGETELAQAESDLLAAQVADGAWTREPVPPPPGWLVFGGRYAEPTTRRAREDELRRLGIAYEVFNVVGAPPELSPGIVLSRHATREAAEAALAALGPRLRGARVAQLPPPPLQQWLRVAQAEPELAERLRTLPSGAFKPCAAPRT